MKRSQKKTHVHICKQKVDKFDMKRSQNNQICSLMQTESRQITVGRSQSGSLLQKVAKLVSIGSTVQE